MAAKAKKKDFASEEDADSARSWPHLPQQLLGVVRSQPTLSQHISYTGVSKSWRTTPKKCNPIGKSPWLQLSNNDNTITNGFSSQRLSYTRGSHYNFPWGMREYYVGCSRGELVAVLGSKRTETFMWHPIYRYFRMFPPWDPNVPIRFAVLSSPSSTDQPEKCFLVVFTGINHPAFVYCRLRADRTGTWTKQDCTIIDPSAPNQSQTQKFMDFTNAVGFGGKIYALSLQGTLAVIEGVDSGLAVTYLGATRAVPSISSKHFREYLFESEGEILLVFLISKNSSNVVDNVEVFRLNVETLSWIKMESLGDRTLIMGVNCCMSILARKIGAKSNCVYFSHHNKHHDDGWWIYNMESGSITLSSSNEYRPSLE